MMNRGDCSDYSFLNVYAGNYRPKEMRGSNRPISWIDSVGRSTVYRKQDHLLGKDSHELVLFLFAWHQPPQKQSSGRRAGGLRARLCLETLEQRTVPTAAVISGYVFNDANDNGLFDSGEMGMANSNLELENASGVVIGTAVSDANGFYQFTTDSSINTNPTTEVETAKIPNSSTDWTQSVSLPQFDPSLGTLTSIEIDNGGTLMSDIKVESLDASPSVITATVSGTLTLTGPGFTPLVTNALIMKCSTPPPTTAFSISAGPAATISAGSQPGTEPVTLSDAASLALYTGTGNVTLTQNAHATSSASGAGNLVTQIASTASGAITITYTYIPSNALKPGNYTIARIAACSTSVHNS